jgi:hypothetical protein
VPNLIKAKKKVQTDLDSKFANVEKIKKAQDLAAAEALMLQQRPA